MSRAEEHAERGTGRVTLATGEEVSLEDIIGEVQAVADQTQSEAYRYEDYADGSRLEIRCVPTPRSSGEFAPAPHSDLEGTLHQTDDGRLYKLAAKIADVKGDEEKLRLWADETDRGLRLVNKDETGEEQELVPVELEWQQVEPFEGKPGKPQLRAFQREVKL